MIRVGQAVGRCFKYHIRNIGVTRLQSTTTNEEPVAEQKAQAASQEQKELDELKSHITIIDDKYKRVLADMENLRQRTAREIEETKKYAILKFCKDLIEIPDTMSLALQNIKPEEVGQDNYKGVSMINDRAIDIFRKHGLISINPKGEKFDPNLHQAMFEMPDASKEPGTVGEVVKIGWQLHDKIVRPALVGVVKKPQ